MTNKDSGQKPKKKATKKPTTKASSKVKAEPATDSVADTAGKGSTVNYLMRPADLEDVSALVAIGNQLGFFDPADDNEAVELLTKYFSGQLAHHAWLVAEVDTTVVGAAYFSPEPKTVGTWNLRFLGVVQDKQGKGCGHALLTMVEETLKMTKGRILAETANTDSLDTARDFLVRNGYAEQGRIKDFFAMGIDKVAHLKALEHSD